MKNPDNELAVLIYYTKPEIGCAEIKELFDVKSSKASQMKKEVKEEMAKRGIKCFLPRCINTKLAYEMWGIDVKQRKENIKQLQRLKLERS